MGADLAALGAELRAEAEAAGQRRALVLHGPAERTADAAAEALAGAEFGPDAVTIVGPTDRPWAGTRVPVREARELLGATRPAVVVDAHGTCRPNALGQVSGIVDGGGLLIYLSPSPDTWSAEDCAFHHAMAVPPSASDAVTTRYHDRLHRLARRHPGIAVYDAAAGTLTSDGLTHPTPSLPADPVTPPAEPRFSPAVYDGCLTPDQVTAVESFAVLDEPGALVIQADRGRGKSSAAGMAVGAMAAEGSSILVTAPDSVAVDPLFERVRETLARLGVEVTSERPIRTESGGSVAFAAPAEAAERIAGGDRPDVLVVDEAAAIPVRRHEEFLAVDRVAFVTTIHGYEGAGRGFDICVRDRLDDIDRPVREVSMSTPIRYAAADPVEVWTFRLLALDARPAVDDLVAPATVDSTSFRALPAAELADSDRHLREAFGLLVTAHYRTEPNDLARLLDAPNVRTMALLLDGPTGEHVVSVALLAAEGGLDDEQRQAMYEGSRIAGNMIPDVLTAHLRDPDAGEMTGSRVLRIATHHAVRSRGLGSRLLEEIVDAVGSTRDWVGVSFGATPRLVAFWDDNGFDPVHLSLRRNDRSGERSVIMVRPTSPAGERLRDAHTAYFADRIGAVLADALAEADPDVLRAVLRAHPGAGPPDLGDRGWRQVVAAAYGPGLFDVDPAPFRDLALAALLNPGTSDRLDPDQQRLLVTKVLQARSWSTVADNLGYVSTSACRRALGEAYRPLIEHYGTNFAHRERDRFQDR